MTRTPIVLPIHTQNVKTILCEESSSAEEANSSPITAPSRVRNSRVIRRLATARVSLAVALVSQSLPRTLASEAPRQWHPARHSMTTTLLLTGVSPKAAPTPATPSRPFTLLRRARDNTRPRKAVSLKRARLTSHKNKAIVSPVNKQPSQTQPVLGRARLTSQFGSGKDTH